MVSRGDAGAARRTRARSPQSGSRSDVVAAGRLSAMQRSRVLVATVGVTAEQGYGGASVEAISRRAGVSRRTFYELFENREQCLVAILRDLEDRIERELTSGVVVDGPWQERVRAGLWTALCVFDSEPALARVCLFESQRGGPLVLAERERILRRLVRIVDEGRVESGDGRGVGTLTAEACVGACLAVLQRQISSTWTAVAGSESRLRDASASGVSARASGRASELLGELMALIVLPYLGAASARQERSRTRPRNAEHPGGEAEAIGADDGLAELPIRLTYRTARVLQAVDELSAAGCAPSNREVGERAGVRDAGQASKLLARLQTHGLVRNTVFNATARGERNQWVLTPLGQRLTGVIGAYTSTRRQQA